MKTEWKIVFIILIAVNVISIGFSTAVTQRYNSLINEHKYLLYNYEDFENYLWVYIDALDNQTGYIEKLIAYNFTYKPIVKYLIGGPYSFGSNRKFETYGIVENGTRIRYEFRWFGNSDFYRMSYGSQYNITYVEDINFNRVIIDVEKLC